MPHINRTSLLPPLSSKLTHSTIMATRCPLRIAARANLTPGIHPSIHHCLTPTLETRRLVHSLQCALLVVERGAEFQQNQAVLNTEYHSGVMVESGCDGVGSYWTGEELRTCNKTGGGERGRGAWVVVRSKTNVSEID